MILITRIQLPQGGTLKVQEVGPNKAATVERLRRKVIRELRRYDREVNHAA